MSSSSVCALSSVPTVSQVPWLSVPGQPDTNKWRSLTLNGYAKNSRTAQSPGIVTQATINQTALRGQWNCSMIRWFLLTCLRCVKLRFISLCARSLSATCCYVIYLSAYWSQSGASADTDFDIWWQMGLAGTVAKPVLYVFLLKRNGSAYYNCLRLCGIEIQVILEKLLFRYQGFLE